MLALALRHRCDLHDSTVCSVHLQRAPVLSPCRLHEVWAYHGMLSNTLCPVLARPTAMRAQAVQDILSSSTTVLAERLPAAATLHLHLAVAGPGAEQSPHLQPAEAAPGTAQTNCLPATWTFTVPHRTPKH